MPDSPDIKLVNLLLLWKDLNSILLTIKFDCRFALLRTVILWLQFFEAGTLSTTFRTLKLALFLSVHLETLLDFQGYLHFKLRFSLHLCLWEKHKTRFTAWIQASFFAIYFEEIYDLDRFLNAFSTTTEQDEKVVDFALLDFKIRPKKRERKSIPLLEILTHCNIESFISAFYRRSHS